MFGHNERLARKLRNEGARNSWATVLESKKEWSSSGGVNVSPGQAGSFNIHQKLKLRVEPDEEPSFEATVRQVFNDARGWHIPQVGWSVAVLYDPSNNSRLVIDLEKMPIRPGVDRNQAHERYDRSVTSARDPEAWRQWAAEQQATAAARATEAAAHQGAAAQTFLGQARATAPHLDVADQLARIADLHRSGVLSDTEFEAAKAKILGTS